MSHFLAYVILEASKLEGGTVDPEGLKRVKKVQADFEREASAGIASGKLSIIEAARARQTIEDTIANLPRFQALHSEIARLLAPYDENARVDPYEHFDPTADSRIPSTALRSWLPPWEAARTIANLPRFEALHSEIGRLLAPYVPYDENARVDPYEQRNAGNGTGQPALAGASSKLPTKVLVGGAKWDWYRIGGRFDGLITQSRVEDDNGFNFGTQHESPEKNTLNGSQLPEGDALKKILPFAIVTPDGAWHEKGSMGWWAIVSDEKSDWKDQAVTLLGKYRSDTYLFVACDLHI